MRAPFWMVVGLISAAVIAWRFEAVVDLAWFMPQPSGAEERLLLERLGQGPGAQLLFVSLSTAADINPAAVSQSAVGQLEESGQFRRVLNGEVVLDPDLIPAVIHDNRYLLSDIKLDDASLRSMLRERLADLMVIEHPLMSELLTQDPAMTSLQILESLNPVAGKNLQWVDTENQAVYLVAETWSPAFDLAGQAEAVGVITSLALPGVTDIAVHGVGAYGVELQDTIRREATFRSILATVIIILILLLAYRRPVAVVVAFLPLALGGLAGLATIALLFGKVHGITLAFGFTLLGVAIDYPLHYLSHTRRNSAAASPDSIWPTMRLGVISSLAAFLAIAAGGSLGLAQMGLFSAVGIVVAYFATRSLMPQLLPFAAEKPGAEQVKSAAPLQISAQTLAPTSLPATLRTWGWLLGAGIVVVLIISVLKPAWTDDMSAVSPVSPARLQADQQLRHQLGAPDIRSVIAIRANELQTVLEQTEEVVNTLDLLIEQDALSNYQSVAALVPSERTQRERRRELNAVKNLAARMEVLSSEQGFRPNSFQPFVAAVNSIATSQQLVTPEIYADTDLATLVAGSLYERDKEWISIVALFGLQDRQQLIDSISATVPGALFVDLKDAANSMMARYRIRVVEMLLLALAVIAVYLVWSLRNLRQVIWVLGTLAAALLVTIAGSSLIWAACLFLT